MSVFTSDGTENLMRWDRSGGAFMEVWYATLNHPPSGLGLWLRYTLTSVDPRYGDPYCELWGFAFDPSGERNFAAKTRYGIDQLGEHGRDDGAIVRIDGAWLAENHLEGAVESEGRTLSWSLDLEPSHRTFQHLPPPLRRRAERTVSTLCSPNLDAAFTGTVKLDGEAFDLEGAPGCQSHRWGRRHASTWAWAHCSLWDDRDEALFEVVSAKAPLGFVPGPTLTFAYLNLLGEDIPFNELRWVRRAKASYEMPTFSFSARNDSWKVVGAGRAHPERLVQVVYTDPDSTLRHCANSEIADLALEVYRRDKGRWLHHRSLTATRTAHLEFGRKEPFRELPVAF